MELQRTIRPRSSFAARLAVALVFVTGSMLGWSTGTASAYSDNASCVEKFNVAVGTPGEYQHVYHQAMLGRDVSVFARMGDECPFP